MCPGEGTPNRGAKLLPLAPHALQVPPIEGGGSKFKDAAYEVDTSAPIHAGLEAVTTTLRTVTPTKARDWFGHNR